MSGGQTGADRGALDAALALAIPHGGFCPRGRRAEDGRIPDRYQLVETTARAYAERTRANVIHSDATLIVCRGAIAGGTALTADLARAHGRPILIVDLAVEPIAEAAGRVRAWLVRHGVETLNVAGPRESRCAGIGAATRELVMSALTG